MPNPHVESDARAGDRKAEGAAAGTYAEATDRLEKQAAREAALDLHPNARSRALSHGRRVDRSIVFFHGITSSPPQFAELGELFYQRGYNVLMPRMPRHGMRDRLSREQGRLTAAELVEYARDSVEIATGLGERVIVAGLSVGALVAAWCAQHRSDVDRAVLIAPSFAPYGVPEWLVSPAARLALRLPDWFIFWHPIKRRRLGPDDVYPGFSTHALAQTFLLGWDVYRAAIGGEPPRARSILGVMNGRDPAVNNGVTRMVLDAWQRHPGVEARRFVFDGTLPSNHDIISTYQPLARTGVVYPKLLELIDE